jgi:hypothetical protein
MRGSMLKLLADLPCALAGLESPAIERVLRDKFTASMNNLALPDGFLKPQKS